MCVKVFLADDAEVMRKAIRRLLSDREEFFRCPDFMGIGFNPEEIDLVKLRERLRQMNDTELRSFGRNALYMTSPAANMDRGTRDSFVLQLDEARAELKRRNDLRDSKK